MQAGRLLRDPKPRAHQTARCVDRLHSVLQAQVTADARGCIPEARHKRGPFPDAYDVFLQERFERHVVMKSVTVAHLALAK